MTPKDGKKATRRTPQKLAIVAYLEGNKGHPSAEDIHRVLKRSFPTMSLSTIYNTLRSLQNEGRVHELAVAGGTARFDAQPYPHHHLVCLECRKVVDIDRDFPVRLAPREASGFRLVHSHISFFGVCPDCQAKSKHPSQKEVH